MHRTTFAILAILSHRSADGGAILQELASTASGERPPSLPTMYRHLRDALGRGWIAVESTSGGGSQGRPGQTYRLTSTGRSAARREARHLTRLATTILDAGPSSKRGAP